MSDSDALGQLAARHGGVYRLHRPVQPAPPAETAPPTDNAGPDGMVGPGVTVEAMLADEGWRVAVVAEVGRTRDFYTALRTALDLPEWTGSNLDALWDVLTDLHEPTALVWRRADVFVAARPQRWPQILAVLEERAAQDPPFAVVLT